MLEVSAYSAVLLVHVVSAVVVVGHSLLAPVSRHLALRAATLPELRAHVELGRRAARWTPVAAMVVLASGAYLGSYGWWTQSWFFVSLGAWLASALLSAAVVQRAEHGLSRAAQAAGEWIIPADADRLRRSRRWTAALASTLANDVAMVVVMYQKPGLAAAAAVVALANAIALATLLTHHHRATKTVILTVSQS